MEAEGVAWRPIPILFTMHLALVCISSNPLPHSELMEQHLLDVDSKKKNVRDIKDVQFHLYADS